MIGCEWTGRCFVILATSLSLTFDLGNDGTSRSQDVHRVESLVFSNDGFKNAQQFCQTFLHQREKVLQIVCKRRRTSWWMRPSTHVSQIQELWITFWSTDWPAAHVFLEFLLVSAVAQVVFCCVYVYGCPPPPPGQVKSAVGGGWEWRSWWLRHVYRGPCFVSSCRAVSEHTGRGLRTTRALS